jgi:hypothetical protein
MIMSIVPLASPLGGTRSGVTTGLGISKARKPTRGGSAELHARSLSVGTLGFAEADLLPSVPLSRMQRCACAARLTSADSAAHELVDYCEASEDNADPRNPCSGVVNPVAQPPSPDVDRQTFVLGTPVAGQESAGTGKFRAQFCRPLLAREDDAESQSIHRSIIRMGSPSGTKCNN